MYRVLDFTTMNQKAGNQIHNRFHYQKEYEQLKEPLILASFSLSRYLLLETLIVVSVKVFFYYHFIIFVESVYRYGWRKC